jgi:adenylate kinase
MFNLIIFGPPGSGKGTQSTKISEKYNLLHISTGEIFRNEIKHQTDLGKRVQAIIERGALVPDELLIHLLKDAIKNNADKEGHIFDGFPRTFQQVKDFDHLLEELNYKLSLVIVLEVDEEEIVGRLLKRAKECGRKDDTEEVIRHRMHVYHNQTAPIIDFYKEKGILESLKGVGSIDEIFRNICNLIEQYQKQPA